MKKLLIYVIILIRADLFSQEGFDKPDYCYKGINTSLFPREEIVNSKIEKVSCSSLLFDTREGKVNQSDFTYEAFFDSIGNPIKELGTSLNPGSRSITTYEYYGDEKLIKYIKYIKPSSKDTAWATESAVEKHYTNNQLIWIESKFFDVLPYKIGRDIIIDTFIYNDKKKIEKILESWVYTDENLRDTLIYTYKYDKEGRLSEFRKRPKTQSFSPLRKFSGGCITPFLDRYAFRYGDDMVCKIGMDISGNLEDIPVIGGGVCVNTICSNQYSTIMYSKSDLEKYNYIRGRINYPTFGQLEIFEYGTYKTTYDKKSNLPETIVFMSNGNEYIEIYKFIYY